MSDFSVGLVVVSTQGEADVKDGQDRYTGPFAVGVVADVIPDVSGVDGYVQVIFDGGVESILPVSVLLGASGGYRVLPSGCRDEPKSLRMPGDMVAMAVIDLDRPQRQIEFKRFPSRFLRDKDVPVPLGGWSDVMAEQAVTDAAIEVFYGESDSRGLRAVVLNREEVGLGRDVIAFAESCGLAMGRDALKGFRGAADIEDVAVAVRFADGRSGWLAGQGVPRHAVKEFGGCLYVEEKSNAELYRPALAARVRQIFCDAHGSSASFGLQRIAAAPADGMCVSLRYDNDVADGSICVSFRLRGILAPEQVAEIKSMLLSGEYLIPEQVGLVLMGDRSEVMVQLEGIAPVFIGGGDVQQSAESFLDAVRATGGLWDTEAGVRNLGLDYAVFKMSPR